MGSILGVNLALLAGLLLVPLLGGSFLAWQIGLFLIYGVAAQGVGFAWGRGGFLPLGNALFFGLGAYGAATVLRATEGALAVNLLAMLAVALACAALAYGLAVLLFRGRIGSGPGFSLVTLALVLIAGQIAETTPALTGGFNGLSGVPPLAGIDPFGAFYYVVVALVVLVTAGLMLIERRPAGLILRALVADEGRLELLGFAPHRVKGWAFAVSAFVTALAGALFASHQGIVTPQSIGFALSTELVIWAAVGGRVSPLEPLLGAVAIGWATAMLRDSVAWWEVAVAAIFLLVVLLLPGGAMDLVARLWRRLRPVSRSKPVSPLPAPPVRVAPPPGGELRLEAVGLDAGGVRILDGLSLAAPAAGVLCVIGPNGAGKTTMLNAITGRMPIRQGRMALGGHALNGRAPHQMLRLGIARKMQVPTVFAGLTVDETLRLALLAGRMRPSDALRRAPLRWRDDGLDALLADPGVPLTAEPGKRAEHLPQGHRQMLELALTLAADPRLVLLDEPAAGMSPAETQVMVRLIRAWQARTGACAIVIEHDMALVESLATEVAVLHQGRVLAQGALSEIRADPQVAAVYAGGHK
ncbi:MAG: ATP-binding cassette domain-containing protein [Rhodobacter sp.]|nr:ATP-binding cassette domain-containing protein [Paracoccaceae bacterium]MCC0072641.1 ATP-binding cassette domain-containing protein [Rhodobacter sp.]